MNEILIVVHPDFPWRNNTGNDPWTESNCLPVLKRIVGAAKSRHRAKIPVIAIPFQPFGDFGPQSDLLAKLKKLSLTAKPGLDRAEARIWLDSLNLKGPKLLAGFYRHHCVKDVARCVIESTISIHLTAIKS